MLVAKVALASHLNGIFFRDSYQYKTSGSEEESSRTPLNAYAHLLQRTSLFYASGILKYFLTFSGKSLDPRQRMFVSVTSSTVKLPSPSTTRSTVSQVAW
jgi:hypothetical protein